MPLIAVTGVPGTGKSTLGSILSGSGELVIDLHKAVVEYGFTLGRDEERDSLEVDLAGLSGFVLGLEGRSKRDIYLEGHVSHLLPVDLVVVLRCHPRVLRARLEARGWSNAKVRENLEAEAMGVITREAADSGLDTYEIDVTDIKVEEISELVRALVRDRPVDEHRPGTIDYFQEIMEWY